VPALRRSNGFARSAAGHSLAAQPVLGMPEVRPPLLDNLPHAAWRHAAGSCPTAQARDFLTVGPAMNAKPDIDDEEDEVLEDEDFEDDRESDEEDGDLDEEDDDEEETWQVSPS
jgi:hypothetical protein